MRMRCKERQRLQSFTVLQQISFHRNGWSELIGYFPEPVLTDPWATAAEKETIIAATDE